MNINDLSISSGNIFINNDLDKLAVYVTCEKNIMTIYKDGHKTKKYKVGENLVEFLSRDYESYQSDFKILLDRMYSFILEEHAYELVYNEVQSLINKYISLTPYMDYLIIPKDITASDFYFNFAHLFDFKSIRKYYKECIDICFNADNPSFSSLSVMNRYYYYTHTRKNPIKFLALINKTIIVQPENIPAEYYNSFFKEFKGSAKDFLLAKEYGTLFEAQTNPELIERFFKNIEIDYQDLFIVESLKGIIELELYLMLIQNYKIRICQNCHKYFVLSNQHDAKYCKRTLGRGKQTCQQIAASARHNENRSDLARIRKECYDSHYKKKKVGMISDETFEEYKEFAKNITRNCRHGELSIEDYENSLKGFNFFAKKQ